jgi:hypothetical protein
MLALALMELLPPGARVSGEAWLNKEVDKVKVNTVNGSEAGARKNLVDRLASLSAGIALISEEGKGPRNFRRPLRYEVGMKL